MIKRFIFLLVSVAMTLSFASCSDGDTVFSYCEMRIGLPEEFREIDGENFDVTYYNGEYLTAILRLSFVAAMREGISETLTPYEFSEFWLEKCNRSANIISDGITYCEYYDDSSGQEHFYLEAFYRSPYAYFVILFSVNSKAEERGRVDFLNYANSVYFTN